MTAPAKIGLTVIEALTAVMGEVQSVGKTGRNQQQGFNFRGIDAVVNAVGPALRKHGVVAVPINVAPTFEQYETKSGTQMRSATLTITWRFYGPMGDFIESQTIGEASDAGDKSVSKAHSVAYRTLLLQALCIPTDEPDPDLGAAHERSVAAPPDPRLALFGEVKAAGHAKKLSDEEIASEFVLWSEGKTVIREATADQLTRFLHTLKAPA